MFALSVLLMAFSVWIYIDTQKIMNSGSWDALGIIVLLPMFIIATVTVVIFAIDMAVICKRTKKRLVQISAKLPIVYTILQIIIWLFVLADVIMFLLLYII